MTHAFVDSDVLIWYLRGDKKAKQFFDGLRVEYGVELWTGANQRAEIVFFMRPGEEDATQAFLAYFKTDPVDAALVDEAGMLYRRLHPSCGLDVNDAFLAASVRKHGGVLYTLNKKHFPMYDIDVVKPW